MYSLSWAIWKFSVDSVGLNGMGQRWIHFGIVQKLSDGDFIWFRYFISFSGFFLNLYTKIFRRRKDMHEYEMGLWDSTLLWAVFMYSITKKEFARNFCVPRCGVMVSPVNAQFSQAFTCFVLALGCDDHLASRSYQCVIVKICSRIFDWDWEEELRRREELREAETESWREELRDRL